MGRLRREMDGHFQTEMAEWKAQLRPRKQVGEGKGSWGGGEGGGGSGEGGGGGGKWTATSR